MSKDKLKYQLFQYDQENKKFLPLTKYTNFVMMARDSDCELTEQDCKDIYNKKSSFCKFFKIEKIS